MADDKIKLFSVGEKDYGGEYKNHLFEQYKLFVESAEKISDRRQQANNYFVAINTALISFISLSFQSTFFQNNCLIGVFSAALGVFICFVFFYLIRAYKKLNTGKFIVIHEIERCLPLALYSYEWKILGEGKSKEKYNPFSHIELLMPWILGSFYLIIGILILIK